MDSESSLRKTPAMDHEAYAGFLKLLLTPTSRVPSLTEELEAYLRYANAREPVSVPASEQSSSQEAA